ncbi:MAG: helicase [Hydrogenophilales bacterium CG_4_9_14_3_um_filter_59_35]|nr:MAG: helicase [Hydrogenophilales bacterium CG18_big_fil_WC_8_21_14_2_50_58_12]PIY00375.1 MAG: helicase [Hydrogenophilales bacterium CG_4_10_14_3_um_filter_58_23]PJB07896.1 MAG: helicase [Hydrogenophilales bacterium CG_4_9_14_3_um_filter_59_35]
MLDLDSIFAEGGVLARSFKDYRVRSQQLEMARSISAAIEKHEILVAEAGTGTGKTYAYLAPALLAGGKVIISTGTKTLQDQLFFRDIPAMRDALKVPVTIAMLKGRANYVCHLHLERAKNEGRFMTRDDSVYLAKIEKFAKRSDSGDKSALSEVPENAGIWAYVTSTRENCLGQDCPQHKDCFVMEARKRAQSADVVVVNHHLFFADVMLRDEGVAELLPASNTVIFDEAHQLPETASLFFGENLSTSQLLELAHDAHAEGMVSAKDFAQLPEGAAALEKAARDLRLVFPQDSVRLPLAGAQGMRGFADALAEVKTNLDALNKLLESQAERSPGLENCWQRGTQYAAQLKRWMDEENNGSVRWVEVFNRAMQLNATPLSIAEIFRKQIDDHTRAWIFTSATLAVKKDFSHYQSQMGLLEAATAFWDSPFDYENQAVLYSPQGLPEPNSSGYTEAVVAAALPVIKASGGRAFLLCTSLRAMREAHELLKEAFEKEGLAFPLLLQGEGTRTELLERFRHLGNAVLVASQSFWEGVDVRGSALSLVIIDKLPFSPPNDPVLAARIEKINQEGRNAFMEYQLPHAVITLKQGAGRLIRDETDRGVLMICDPRLLTKQYGRRIWQSLPPMKRTREVVEVEKFFELQTGE